MRIIAHISDLHFGRVDPTAVESLAADIHQQRPHLLVASGDFTQRARRRQYAAAAAFLARLPGPRICVPGNHDIPLFDVIRRFFFPLNRYRHYITADLEPFFCDEELAVIGLNSARSWTWTLDGFWKDGRISRGQLQSLQSKLAELPGGLFRVVVTHHPFIPPPGERLHGIIRQAPRALETIAAAGVDLLLAGHLHMGYSGDVRTHHEAVKRSILSVQAGTAVSTRRRQEPNAYNMIRVERDRVTVQTRAYSGSRFEPAEETRYIREAGAWISLGGD